jgi:hypothetical protein
MVEERDCVRTRAHACAQERESAITVETYAIHGCMDGFKLVCVQYVCMHAYTKHKLMTQDDTYHSQVCVCVTQRERVWVCNMKINRYINVSM